MHTPLVINWHPTEACDYRCHYCSAAWCESTCLRDLIYSPERTAALLSELYRLFQPANRTNSLASRMAWNSVRLNGSKHSRLTHPAGGPTLTVSRTPSDWRSVQNFIRDLRRVKPEVLVGTNSTKQTCESHRASR
jgi:hypothetical protein